MDDDAQAPRELNQLFAEDGPIFAAARWLYCVLIERNLDIAWPLTDPDYRGALVDAWLQANAGHAHLAGVDVDAAARALIEDRPSHPLWESFSTTQLSEFGDAWEEVDLELWGWASRPRPLTLGYEVVRLVKSDGKAFSVDGQTHIEALSLVMHHIPREGWLCAGQT